MKTLTYLFAIALSLVLVSCGGPANRPVDTAVVEDEVQIEMVDESCATKCECACEDKEACGEACPEECKCQKMECDMAANESCCDKEA